MSTYVNRKSGATVQRVKDFKGLVQYKVGNRIVRVSQEDFERKFAAAYQSAADTEPEAIPPPAAIVAKARQGGRDSVMDVARIASKPLPKIFKTAERQPTPQHTYPRGALRSKMTASESEYMRLVHELVPCCMFRGCGELYQLEASHSPSSEDGKAGAMKASPWLIALLCRRHHVQIDQRLIPDAYEQWVRAEHATRDYLMRKLMEG